MAVGNSGDFRNWGAEKLQVVSAKCYWVKGWLQANQKESTGERRQTGHSGPDGADVRYKDCRGDEEDFKEDQKEWRSAI